MFLKSNKSPSKIETILGPCTEIEGNITTKDSIRIDGKIKGELHAHGVIIGEHGIVIGDIIAMTVTVAGRVKGNVTAQESLDLLSKSQISGDIKTAKLVISDGAVFEGNCQMTKGNGQVIELNPGVNGDRENQKNLKVVASGKH